MSQSSRYPIPAGPARAEITVLNSRFIASAGYTPTVEAARELIAAARAEMPDAAHHCYAFLVGFGSSVTAGMSDDGEPAGTAGRPMLAVLRGSGLGDVTVVVTRYFGGTLLGTGGLVRAYGDGVRAVLEVLPREEKVERCPGSALVPYGAYALARRALEAHQALITGEEFAADVLLSFTIPLEKAEQVEVALSEVTAGQAIVQLAPP